MQAGSVRSYVTIGLCTIAVIVMVALGQWQLTRMHEKQQRLDSIAQKQQLGVVDLVTLLNSAKDIRDYPVRLLGTLDTAHTMFLDNRLYQGRVGYEALVPMRTDVGAVLLNFGWTPAENARSRLPEIVIRPELITVEGVINIPQDNVMVSETAQVGDPFPLRIQQIDIPLVSQFIGEPLLPFVVQVTMPEHPDFTRNWQPVVMPPEKHLAYAVQWFALACAATAVIVSVIVREVRHGKRSADQS